MCGQNFRHEPYFLTFQFKLYLRFKFQNRARQEPLECEIPLHSYRCSRRRKVYCWNWDNSEMEMQGEDEGNTGFAALPQSEIKGIARFANNIVLTNCSKFTLFT